MTHGDIKFRDSKFDILRGFGIIFMVMGHVGFGDTFSHYIHAFHMPIFFFVTGYFYNGQQYKTYAGFVKHDLKTLILPYTVFWFVCQILHYLYVGEYSLRYGVLSYFSSNHNRIDVSGAYWFLLCLFTAKQIFYLLYQIKNVKIRIVFIFLFTLTGNVLRQFVKLPLCIDSAMSSLLLIYLGNQYRQMKDKDFFRRIMNLPPWGLVIGLLINGALILMNSAVNLRTNYYANIPLYWLNSIVAIWLFLQVSMKISIGETKICKFLACSIAYFGRNSIVFLVLNELMIFLVGTVCHYVGVFKFSNFYIANGLVFGLTMAGLVFANEIFVRTKLKILIGK